MDNIEHKEMWSSEHLLAWYQKIHGEGDPGDKIEALSSTAREYLASTKYFRRHKAFDFYGFTKEFIEHSIGKKPGNKAWSFKDLQNVFQKLENYGLRLLKRPWRREFHTIKLFTTFYKHDIESRLPSAVRILQLYGYRDVSKNMVKIDSLDSNTIFFVCFELFLSTIELEVMSEICKSIEDEYTSDFTLTDVFLARRRTKGDVKEAVEYFITKNPEITRAKRIKTDDTESGRKFRDKFDRSDKFPAEGEETRKIDFDNGRITSQGRTKRDTKYPPTPADYSNLPSSSDHGFAPVTVSAKVQHISSSVPSDHFSDADLYGHDDSSSSHINENNIPMDTQEAQPWSGTSYDPNFYVDMTGAYGNDYEMMYAGPDTGDSSCTTLPPPPGIPPPTYDQATKIPGNDWVMVDNNNSDVLSNNISAMNIGENGQLSRTSAEVVGVRGRVHETPDIQMLKAASANNMGLSTTSNTNPTYDRIGPQGTSSKTEVVGSSALKKHSVEVKGNEDVSIKRPLFDGSVKDFKTTTASFVTSFDNRLPEKSALYTFETSGVPSKGKADRRMTSSLGSREKMGTSKANEQYLKDRLVRSGSEEPSYKRMSVPNVPTATHTYLTSSYGGSTTTAYSYPKTQSAVTTRSQSRAAAAAASKPDVMSEPLQGTSKTTQKMAERYSKENCTVCNSEATHYCIMCKKRSCKSCITVIPRLPCDSYKEHLLVEVSPTASNYKVDLGSKDDCSFCGVNTASHYCIFCDKKSCATCPTVYTKDPCVMGKETHYFVNQQQQKALERQTGTQNETTPSSTEKKPNSISHVTGENYCDFCALAADLICKSCLKTICDKCKHVYKQDLCPPTKREHQFENINEQSPNTNEATESSSWSCERCTLLNSPNHRICAVCATSRGVNRVDLPKSGSRKCHNCTYGNEEGATVCKMCHRTFGLETPESYI